MVALETYYHEETESIRGYLRYPLLLVGCGLPESGGMRGYRRGEDEEVEAEV
jgi:hypothetical protein